MRNYYMIFVLGIVIGMLLIVTIFLLFMPEYYTEYRYGSYLLTIGYAAISILYFRSIKSIKK
jgi:hypothetical protein